MRHLGGYRWSFHSLVVLFILTVIAACSSTPDGVLPEDKMARLLADIYIAESITEMDRATFYNDSMKKVLKQSVLLKNGVTSAEFDSSLSWYGYNMDKFVAVYDKVLDYLQEDMERVQSTAGSNKEVTASQRVDVEGDSVDVWPDIRYRRFASNLPTDILSFAITSDQNWEKGDVYDLSARVIGSDGPTEMTLVTEYQDGSKEYNSRVEKTDGWHRLKLVLDPQKTAASVYGYIRYDAKPGEQVFMDSISLVRTRRQPRTDAMRLQQKSLSNKYGR